MAPAIHALPLLEAKDTDSAAVAPSNHASTCSDQGPRCFNSNGEYKITVFNDLHFGERELVLFLVIKDTKTLGLMGMTLDKEKPNLVVLNGDIVSNDQVSAENEKNQLEIALGPLLHRNQAWASTYGNHDPSKTVSTRTMLEFEQQLGGKNCWTKNNMVEGEENDVGTSNYYLLVNSSFGLQPKMILWFFDRRGGKQFDNGGPMDNWVHQNVVDWFNAQKKKLKDKYGRAIPSLAFVHIPIFALYKFAKNGVDPDRYPGFHDRHEGWRPQGLDCVDNDCTYGGHDSAFVNALIHTDGHKAVFSGHQHSEDWCMKWDEPVFGVDPSTGHGVIFCLGGHSGFGGYGAWTRSSRQISIDTDSLGRVKTVETYVLLEDGTRAASVKLNNTYGQDKYPEVPLTWDPEGG
ncbi:Metallo-dependent phosphatase [Polyplosphaeria fusca]|uniref:Metallo-dependent phosphatase n=1 Tax=Polyplosphaeria fusca TaxID=682080 RepID=A0A9P4QRX0_9PLEO|nr:Metallo-dependent phosphatase [Polyplosphaeria fusca]